MIGRALLEIGGPTHSLTVRGNDYYWELPPYCGLVRTNKNGDPIKTPWPKYVWEAVQKAIDDERNG